MPGGSYFLMPNSKATVEDFKISPNFDKNRSQENIKLNNALCTQPIIYPQHRN